MTDIRPANCRNRLRDEGKAYPRSGCAYCKNGGLIGCQFDKSNPRIKSQDEITEGRIRAIHSRLDVHKQAMLKLARSLNIDGNLDLNDWVEFIEMLEESQNPFEVSDENDS